MLRSPSRSPTSALPLLAALAAAPLAAGGCSDDCGPDGAPATGLHASADALELTYGDLSGLLGNDCPDPAAPAGVISLSIEGRQDTGAGLITLCVPRPDLLLEGDRTLGNSTSAADVRIIDLNGVAGGCTYTLQSAQPPTGVARATGVCDNGDSPKGFALSLDGAVTLRRVCGPAMDTVQVTLRGRVAVSRRAI